MVVRTLETTPPDATHWSTRSMAKACGLSPSTVSRIWRAFGLQPHRAETFKLSTDPLFIEKVRDIVGLYLNPPDRALVLCVDEKTQVQALDRMQPLLPMRPGQVERRLHDYVRHGTTSLFAALDVATGRVIGDCHQRHRSVEFRKFLDTIDTAVPKDLEVHLVVDNYGGRTLFSEAHACRRVPSTVKWSSETSRRRRALRITSPRTAIAISWPKSRSRFLVKLVASKTASVMVSPRNHLKSKS